MKINQILYRIWLAALAILVIVCSLERSPVMIGGTVRTTCFAMLGMLVLNGLLLLIPGTRIESTAQDNTFAAKDTQRGSIAAASAQNSGDVAAANAQGRGSAADAAYGRLSATLCKAVAFVLAAVLYWCYCFRMSGWISTNSKMDALVAGGLICAAVVLSGGCSGQRDLRRHGL
ncbi:MAG: hypothetical protein LUI87_04350 [Lachnospiraceae bacterium]|nr:hypothetical protein [Lachnospiraceae bacterium]